MSGQAQEPRIGPWTGLPPGYLLNGRFIALEPREPVLPEGSKWKEVRYCTHIGEHPVHLCPEPSTVKIPTVPGWSVPPQGEKTPRKPRKKRSNRSASVHDEVKSNLLDW